MNKNIIIAILAAALIIVGGTAFYNINQQKAETARIVQLMEEEKAAREKKEAEERAEAKKQKELAKKSIEHAVNYKW